MARGFSAFNRDTTGTGDAGPILEGRRWQRPGSRKCLPPSSSRASGTGYDRSPQEGTTSLIRDHFAEALICPQSSIIPGFFAVAGSMPGEISIQM